VSRAAIDFEQWKAARLLIDAGYFDPVWWLFLGSSFEWPEPVFHKTRNVGPSTILWRW
jgi:hypothetical protein